MTRLAGPGPELLRPALAGVVPYEPGKPTETVQRELGLERVVKLASNEGPFGPFPEALEAIARAVPESNRYPDGGCYRLRAALSDRHGVAFEEIVVAAGADAVIGYVCQATLDAGDEIVTPWPSFPSYVLGALKLGATHAIEPKDAKARVYGIMPGGPDLVVEAAGAIAAVKLMVELRRRGTRWNLFGITTHETFELDGGLAHFLEGRMDGQLLADLFREIFLLDGSVGLLELVEKTADLGVVLLQHRQGVRRAGAGAGTAVRAALGHGGFLRASSGSSRRVQSRRHIPRVILARESTSRGAFLQGRASF